MIFIALLCVIGIAIGQILFKISAGQIADTGTFFNLRVLIPLGCAFLLYGLTSLVWVWTLQKIELGRIYPLMALAFVFVPLGGYFFLGERFQPQYYFGVAIIILGIFITIRS